MNKLVNSLVILSSTVLMVACAENESGSKLFRDNAFKAGYMSSEKTELNLSQQILNTANINSKLVIDEAEKRARARFKEVAGDEELQSAECGFQLDSLVLNEEASKNQKRNFSDKQMEQIALALTSNELDGNQEGAVFWPKDKAAKVEVYDYNLDLVCDLQSENYDLQVRSSDIASAGAKAYVFETEVNRTKDIISAKGKDTASFLELMKSFLREQQNKDRITKLNAKLMNVYYDDLGFFDLQGLVTNRKERASLEALSQKCEAESFKERRKCGLEAFQESLPATTKAANFYEHSSLSVEMSLAGDMSAKEEQELIENWLVARNYSPEFIDKELDKMILDNKVLGLHLDADYLPSTKIQKGRGR